MNCLVCKKEYISKTKTSKYCSLACFHVSSKGIKKPHSKEWEENRIKAVREAAKNKIYPKGYKRPKEHTQPMIEAYHAAKRKNPEKYREIAIKNLSKNNTMSLSKENSPNWRGGITKDWQQWKSENGKNFEAVRKLVNARDNSCKSCGSVKDLECHHIIPVSESKETAFLPMNVVLLCHECHKNTTSFGGKSARKNKKSSIGNTICVMQVIPHKWQIYPTVGNYDWTKNGTLVIFVSDMGNDDYHMLVFLHEMVEAHLTKVRGITEKSISNFDIEFEKKRQDGNVDEPGDDPNAPYRKEHFFATSVERLLAAELGVDWKEYDDAVNSL